MTLCVTSLSPLKAEDRSVVEPWGVLEKQGLIRMRYLEFRLLKQIEWILRGKERSPISRVARNVTGIVRLLMSRNQLLIIGTEPFRPISFLLPGLKSRHRCIWHGSWPWEDEQFAYGWRGAGLRRRWTEFLKGTVCVCATAPARAALEKYGARAFHIPWPVDTQVFVPPAERRQDGEVRVLFVGELNKTKGVHVLLDVIKGSKWSHTRFVFAGRGAYMETIMGMAKDGLPVEYLGFVQGRMELARTMQGCDMLVLPSVRIGGIEEKFGMVLIEAMACGLPVIGSDCIGPRQIIAHGRNGLVIPQEDVQALQEAIERLAGSPELRSQMGKRGREEAEKVYDTRSLAAKWLEVIQAAAGGTAGGGPRATECES